MTEATTTPKRTVRKAPAAKKPAVKKAAPKSDKTLFATFATGGKQYRVSVGDLVKIEKLQPLTDKQDWKEGDIITFDSVLLIDNGASEITLGTPFIKDSVVSTTLNKIGRYKTVDVIKYKQKSRYFKKYGHRQPYFEVKVNNIK